MEQKHLQFFIAEDKHAKLKSILALKRISITDWVTSKIDELIEESEHEPKAL